MNRPTRTTVEINETNDGHKNPVIPRAMLALTVTVIIFKLCGVKNEPAKKSLMIPFRVDSSRRRNRINRYFFDILNNGSGSVPHVCRISPTGYWI